MPEKTNVAIVFGGRSAEHDVSIISASNICENIDKTRFNLFLFGISKSGKWFLMPEVVKDFSRGNALQLALDAENPVFTTHQDNSQIRIDVAFVILHGTDGEDGTIQGFFKLMRIPVVGSGVLGSAVSMDKITAKKLLIQGNIPTAKGLFLYKHEEIPEYDDMIRELGSPVIVKPSNQGSSIGISKVTTESDYMKAIEDAFMYDESLLIEEFIDGRELECSILGNSAAQASPPGEIELNKKYEIYSFDAKYVDGEATKLQIPAIVPDTLVSEIKEICLKAYHVLCCKDFARVDLFLKSNGDVLINEVNTLPGFTNISMYPKLCELMGISYDALISQLIDLALARNRELRNLQTEYISGLS